MKSSSFRSAIITIGDEILVGQVVNTNASYLGKELFSLGLPVERIISVPDRENEIIKEFRSAWKKYDVIIVTGGLGPTHDDITKKCVAKFFKSDFMLDTTILKSVKQMFARRNIPMPPVNIGQALIPECAIAVPNKTGTAPGLIIDKGRKTFCVLPGVPYEMKHLCEKGVFPHLKKGFSKRKTNYLRQKTLHTIGIGESLLAKKLGNIYDIVKSGKDYSVKLAFLPSNFEVRLRITASASSDKKAKKLVADTEKYLRKKAGMYIYSSDESPIEKTVGVLLKKNDLTIAAAESCTGGLICSRLTDIGGSADYVVDGIVAYSNDAKKKLLGVNPKTLKAYGAVSEQTAVEMAKGIRKVSKTDIGISTTGIAGPTGASKGKPVGLVWIGYSDKNTAFAKKFIFTKDRLRNKDIMSKMALELVRRKLLAIEN
jgi:nicotinamide-nucleotide amidase